MKTTMQCKKTHGFTLIEIAMVLMIVALVLGGLLPTISSQIEQKQINDTRRQLDEIKDALIGYAVANGRLPCPATAASNGEEKPVGGGNCSNFYNGYVPAATLGFSGTVNNQGLLIDSWGNPIRYVVTTWDKATPNVNNVFTSINGMSTVGITSLAPTLLVCATVSSSNNSCSVANSALTPNGVPAIIFSTGKNGSSTPPNTNKDELANALTSNNPIFVNHPYAPSSAANGEFDDIMIWVSTNVLVNRMISAGQLP
ncbi:MAG: prepilin-type N-terminal cleavage/methylation domain-containing protein [Gallionella sp.]|nr:prepilin-type N-terminal cleavage/methylation domain-containing protein [Gallionella sp.]